MSSVQQLPPVLVLFGRPGSGKGTIAQALVERFGYVQCSTGQAMRDWAAGNSPEQRELRAALARGEYASDELAARIVGDFLAGLPAGTPGAILDGFPRNLAQLAAWRDLGIDALYVVVESDEATARARIAERAICPVDGFSTSRGRDRCSMCGAALVLRPEDVDPAALDKRMADFERLMQPVIREAAKLGLVLIVRNSADTRLSDLDATANHLALTLRQRAA